MIDTARSLRLSTFQMAANGQRNKNKIVLRKWRCRCLSNLNVDVLPSLLLTFFFNEYDQRTMRKHFYSLNKLSYGNDFRFDSVGLFQLFFFSFCQQQIFCRLCADKSHTLAPNRMFTYAQLGFSKPPEYIMIWNMKCDRSLQFAAPLFRLVVVFFFSIILLIQ